MNKSKYVPILLAVLLVTAGLGAFGYAAATSSSTVIYACANKTNGQMRLASGPQDCKQQERLLSWNQAGATGPQGPQGPAGPQGPQGPAGSTGIYVVTQTGHFAEGSTEDSITAGCEEAVVLGFFDIPQAGSQVIAVNPRVDGHSVTWSHDNSEAQGSVSHTVGLVCMQLAE